MAQVPLAPATVPPDTLYSEQTFTREPPVPSRPQLYTSVAAVLVVLVLWWALINWRRNR